MQKAARDFNEKFGTPEQNNVLSVEDSFRQAVQRGYLSRLQAYGIGKGLTMEEAEMSMRENMGVEIHSQPVDDYRKLVDYARKEETRLKKEAYLNAVSMGDDKVKAGSSPISAPEAETSNNGGEK